LETGDPETFDPKVDATRHYLIHCSNHGSIFGTSDEKGYAETII
jgi:hypothetical protein